MQGPEPYPTLQEWCNRNDYFLAINNETHWQVTRNGCILVDFWPTTGKWRSGDARKGEKGRSGGVRAVIDFLDRLKTERTEADVARETVVTSRAKQIADAAAPMIAEAVMKQLDPILKLRAMTHVAFGTLSKSDTAKVTASIEAGLAYIEACGGSVVNLANGVDYAPIIDSSFESAVAYIDASPHSGHALYRTPQGLVEIVGADAYPKPEKSWVKIDHALIQECREAVEANRPKPHEFQTGEPEKIPVVDMEFKESGFFFGPIARPTKIPRVEVHITDDGVVEKSAGGTQGESGPDDSGLSDAASVNTVDPGPAITRESIEAAVREFDSRPNAEDIFYGGRGKPDERAAYEKADGSAWFSSLQMPCNEGGPWTLSLPRLQRIAALFPGRTEYNVYRAVERYKRRLEKTGQTLPRKSAESFVIAYIGGEDSCIDELPKAVNEPEGEAAYREDRIEAEPVHPMPSDLLDLSAEEWMERATYLIALHGLLASGKEVAYAACHAERFAKSNPFTPR